MSDTTTQTATVNILDKGYRVSCKPEEQRALVDAAQYLDSKMREIRERGAVVGLERIAVMAALNIAHELLQLAQQRQLAEEDTQAQLQSLLDKVEQVLTDSDTPAFD
ncbi:cell division protein ZapA [Spartinivicinus poritis]|uniref:Cell division protein ZapA n=1 Tax=Spartinivicinus poritis TaxID=2994640 RepID=A0ABT5U839_9GAMM|nr:cell division protein ZapA [Spartinivicinus sp. A2-2]MDE1462530.1 cell division protein ZapA [Spartinivicinus sp. A2-2]